MKGRFQYQWENFISDNKAKKEIDKWECKYGPIVMERDSKGYAKSVRFQLLLDNPNSKVYLIGKFNGWGEINLDEYELKHDENSLFCYIDVDCMKHKDAYKFLLKQNDQTFYMQDPAGVFFDDIGNTIFWDYKDPTTYKQKYDFIDTVNRSTKVMQTDLPGLITHFADKKGVCGRDIKNKEYYKFITESGVIEHIKKLGFNTIQFLPFAQSIDGDNWKFRYLVPFQFAIQKNWGTPDEFSRMIDEFHKHDIAVIGDFVIGHLPFKDYNVFGCDGELEGIQIWLNRHNTRLYMKEETPWGTMRIDYDNEYIRKFIVSSCLHFLKYYKIDGLRIDNVDGILRYGHNGDGDERPNGRRFLRELAKTLYEYNPFALIHLESHFFKNDNAKMLVVPFEEDKRALGATCYNSSRLTYYFHTQLMPKSGEKISAWKFQQITEEKEWGQSNSTIADFHNHDAAAGLMEMRCTGSYAYDTMTIKQPHNHYNAIGKIKVMEAIIAFCTEGRILDLIQTFLLQTGTFEHDSSIQWHLAFTQASNNMVEYKRRINELMDEPSFFPMFTKNRKFLNIDDINKIIVVERSCEYKGRKQKFVVVINLTSWIHHNYKVGVIGSKNYKVIFNSDLFDYAGSGMASFPKILKNGKSQNFEYLDRELELPKLGPYNVVVLEEQG